MCLPRAQNHHNASSTNQIHPQPCCVANNRYFLWRVRPANSPTSPVAAWTQPQTTSIVSPRPRWRGSPSLTTRWPPAQPSPRAHVIKQRSTWTCGLPPSTQLPPSSSCSPTQTTWAAPSPAAGTLLLSCYHPPLTTVSGRRLWVSPASPRSPSSSSSPSAVTRTPPPISVPVVV